METANDILEKIGKPAMGVHEGYFDSLNSRLEAIPSSRTSRPGVWTGVRPYLALAASFAAIVLIGNAVLRDTVKDQSADPFAGIDSYADIISITNPEILYNDPESYFGELSDEDIINYLIESGTRTEHLAYAGEAY
ncbi:MAG: hypothetical protein IJ840_05810 [Bacteroidales bacterium]|nr:hypothetical protein [Bacteroidales bacterium]